MTNPVREKLDALSKRLRDEQRASLVAAAQSDGLPSTLRRVSQLEFNSAAIENTLAEI